MLPASCPQISAPSSATSAKPNNIPRAPTTFSLAIRPVAAATAIFQSPHPSGAKRGARTPPMPARILQFSCSASNMPKEPSVHPKRMRNQRTIVDNRIIVPAFLMKDHPRSHMLRRTLPTVGR